MKKPPPPKYLRRSRAELAPRLPEIAVRSPKPPIGVEMSNAVARICANLGVEICKPHEHQPVAGKTSARATLERLYRDHGEGHLVLVLRTITETENAHIRIDTFTLQAISGLIIAHPEWVNSGLRWLEVFDRIDLSEMQTRAKFNRDVVAQRDGIATMLYQELSRAFEEDIGPQTGEEDATMPIDNDLLYGTRAIAGYLELSIQKCRDLINLGGIPTFTMPGSTTRCARKSSLTPPGRNTNRRPSRARWRGDLDERGGRRCRGVNAEGIRAPRTPDPGPLRQAGMHEPEAGRRCRWKVRVDHAGMAEEHGLGRRIGGGVWSVSRVALAMFLDGNRNALRAYHQCDRVSEAVFAYFRRAGLLPPI